jgi:hypothetical protein
LLQPPKRELIRVATAPGAGDSIAPTGGLGSCRLATSVIRAIAHKASSTMMVRATPQVAFPFGVSSMSDAHARCWAFHRRGMMPPHT